MTTDSSFQDRRRVDGTCADTGAFPPPRDGVRLALLGVCALLVMGIEPTADPLLRDEGSHIAVGHGASPGGGLPLATAIGLEGESSESPESPEDNEQSPESEDAEAIHSTARLRAAGADGGALGGVDVRPGRRVPRALTSQCDPDGLERPPRG